MTKPAQDASQTLQDGPGATQTKPLHVRVAEALGWMQIEEAPRKDEARSKAEGRFVVAGSDWFGSAPADCPVWGALVKMHGTDAPAGYAVPRYDTDWSATGPLIERYRIDLGYFTPFSYAPEAPWGASVAGSVPDEPYGYGSTPLIAVCHLILALKEAGKLNGD